jgi:hypothetical protein
MATKQRLYGGRVIGQIVVFEAASAALFASSMTGAHSTAILVGQVIFAVVGGWILIRSRQARQSISNADDAQKLAGEWRGNYLAERQAREDAVKEAVEQRELKHAALNEAAALRAQTDLTAVMTALIEIQKTGTKSAEVLDKVSRRLDQIDPPPRPRRAET